jgi:PAS domain-containing protein
MNERKNLFSKVFKVLKAPNAYSFYTLFFMWALCTLFYYLGEIVDLAHWEAIRWEFLSSVHDIHRLVYLVPIIYSAYVFGVKATIIFTILSMMTFLPRAIFISPYPDPLARMLIFAFIAGIVGYLIAITRREIKKQTHLQTLLKDERNRLSGILDGIQAGVLLVGPDYKIRYMNESVSRDFGGSVGTYCYKILRGQDAPCHPLCKMSAVLKGEIQKWEYNFPDGRIFEVTASSYPDIDGVVCQLMIFRKTSKSKKSMENRGNVTD